MIHRKKIDKGGQGEDPSQASLKKEGNKIKTTSSHLEQRGKRTIIATVDDKSRIANQIRKKAHAKEPYVSKNFS